MSKSTKRIIIIEADDGETQVKVTVELVSVTSLVQSEVYTRQKETARALARALESVPWADFGADNITVKKL